MSDNNHAVRTYTEEKAFILQTSILVQQMLLHHWSVDILSFVL